MDTPGLAKLRAVSDQIIEARVAAVLAWLIENRHLPPSERAARELVDVVHEAKPDPWPSSAS